MADNLVNAPADLTSPRNAKFTAKTPAAGAGESGAGELFAQPENLYCPANVKSPAPGKNSNESGKSLSQAVSVDFGTGMHSSPDQKR